MTAVRDLGDFRGLDPFFRIIEEGVAGLVDGEHFFDLLAEDVVFEYVITVPGYPRRVEGRQAVAGLYRPYSAVFCLDRCYDLAVHHDRVTGVVVLEYASQGRVIATGTAYGNRYISVLSIVDRKIAHWRDYLDPVAVFDAIGWPAAATGSPGTPGAAGAEESLRPNGRQFMLGTLARTLAIVVAAGGVAATPAAAAGPVHDLAAKVAPKQFFVGLVNGKTRKAVIRVLCPGPASSGHPLPHQSVRVNLFLPPAATANGHTGTAGTSIAAWLNWPASARPPGPAYVATYTRYGSAPIPTSIQVPCSGPGQMLFLPAPGSQTVKAATVSLTFASTGT